METYVHQNSSNIHRAKIRITFPLSNREIGKIETIKPKHLAYVKIILNCVLCECDFLSFTVDAVAKYLFIIKRKIHAEILVVFVALSLLGFNRVSNVDRNANFLNKVFF